VNVPQPQTCRADVEHQQPIEVAVSDQASGRDVRSCRISISLPLELHGRLQALSTKQQRSLSNLCALLLAEAVEKAQREST